MTASLIYSTWPNAETARACAAQLIEKRVAACVTVLPVAHSTFIWEGKVQQADETVMLVKTDKRKAGEAQSVLRAAHPYDLPCVLALDINPEGSNPDFLQWVATETNCYGRGAADTPSAVRHSGARKWLT